MPTRRLEKQEHMFAIVEQYLQSNQAQREFCRSISIPLSTLQYWHKKYRLAKSKLSSPPSTTAKPSFIPMSISVPSLISGSLHPGVIIRYPNGVMVRIHGAPDTRQILELVHGTLDHAI